MKQGRVFEWRWFFLIGVSILVFFPEIVFLQKGFLSGDHRLQHYPWFFYYAQGIKKLALPWWTSFNQCGFPLLAEGQIGAFYPLNFIFAFFFPVRWGYNYSVLAHYFLGGAFFFLYVRKIGIRPVAAFWSTLIFLFGSSQAGFFYNVTSQRVLIWFPLSLWFIHRLFEKHSWRDALSLGVVFALEALAGYQQYAVYATGFAVLYFLVLWFHKGRFFSRREKGLELLLLALSVVFSFLIALPQWVPFLELSHFSSRKDLVEAFAYIGSMHPAGPLTLFFPSWQGILGAELYVGVLGIFFVFFTLWHPGNAFTRVHWILFGAALLLAWGGFSPFYVGLIKATHFYGFRIPVKFLFFASFSLAVLSGWGVHSLLDPAFKHPQENLKKAFAFFVKLSGWLWGGVFIGAIVFRVARRPILAFLESWVKRYIIGQPYRPHSPEVYLEKLHSFYSLLLKNLSPLNPWLLGTLAIFLMSGFLLAILSRQRQATRTPWIFLLFLLLYGDLYAYGYRNIRGDYERFTFVHRPSPVVDYLRKDASLFRVYNIGPQVPREEILLASNSNIVDGIENIGVYSPFAFRGFKDFVVDLGAVDDSIDAPVPTEAALYQNLDRLRYLNTKYVISTRPLRHPALKERVHDQHHILYELEGVLPRFLFAGKNGEEKPLQADSTERAPNRFQLTFGTPAAGLLLVNEVYYPGWRADLDGQEVRLERSHNLFRRVEIPAGGNHRLEMSYRPPYFYGTLGIAFLALALFLYSLGKNSLGGIFLVWNFVVLVGYFAWVVYGRFGV